MKIRLLIIFTIGILGLNGIYFAIPDADAHNITYAATTFVRIENEIFDKHYLQTGETLTVNGSIRSNVEKDLRGWLSIFSESSDMNNRWEIMARDPPETVFVVPGNSSTEYSITVKALESGTYHMHSQFNIDKIGSQLGLGQTIVVEGDFVSKPIAFTNIAYDLIPIITGCVVVIAMISYFWRKRK